MWLPDGFWGVLEEKFTEYIALYGGPGPHGWDPNPPGNIFFIGLLAHLCGLMYPLVCPLEGGGGGLYRGGI